MLARIRSEEALLALYFGAEYDAYRARTARLIPGIYQRGRKGGGGARGGAPFLGRWGWVQGAGGGGPGGEGGRGAGGEWSSGAGGGEGGGGGGGRSLGEGGGGEGGGGGEPGSGGHSPPRLTSLLPSSSVRKRIAFAWVRWRRIRIRLGRVGIVGIGSRIDGGGFRPTSFFLFCCVACRHYITVPPSRYPESRDLYLSEAMTEIIDAFGSGRPRPARRRVRRLRRRSHWFGRRASIALAIARIVALLDSLEAYARPGLHPPGALHYLAWPATRGLRVTIHRPVATASASGLARRARTILSAAPARLMPLLARIPQTNEAARSMPLLAACTFLAARFGMLASLAGDRQS